MFFVLSKFLGFAIKPHIWILAAFLTLLINRDMENINLILYR